jgi:sulfur carrier protein
MNIRCNDQEVQLEAENLASALVELGYQDLVVATALNGEFVPRTLRSQTPLRAGDQIDILAPQQGG